MAKSYGELTEDRCKSSISLLPVQILTKWYKPPNISSVPWLQNTQLISKVYVFARGQRHGDTCHTTVKQLSLILGQLELTQQHTGEKKKKKREKLIKDFRSLGFRLWHIGRTLKCNRISVIVIANPQISAACQNGAVDPSLLIPLTIKKKKKKACRSMILKTQEASKVRTVLTQT